MGQHMGRVKAWTGHDIAGMNIFLHAPTVQRALMHTHNSIPDPFSFMRKLFVLCTQAS